MSSTVENFKFPVGSRENPAMTCKELMDVDNIQDGKGDSYSGPRGLFLSPQAELTPEVATTSCRCGSLKQRQRAAVVDCCCRLELN